MTIITRLAISAAAVLALLLLGRATPFGWAAPRPAETGPVAEVWRLGAPGETAPDTTALFGRPLAITGVFRSNEPSAEQFFVFPASSRQVTVDSAAFAIIRRSGSYTGAASLALEVRDGSGSLRRILSTASIDLQAVTAGGWASLALDADPAARALAQDEHLVIRMARDGAAGGDLDVRPVFEVAVHSGEALAATATATPMATTAPTATATPTTTPTTYTVFLPHIQR